MNIYFENLAKDYNGRIIFKNISGRINEFDKIGLIGVNGVGKTTLLRLITFTEACDAGRIKYSPDNLKIRYMNQFFSSMQGRIDLQEAIDYIKAYGGGRREQAILKELGFDSDILEADINKLSGGEKTKLMLSRVLLDEFDVLVLDEPTNHLDIESSHLLEMFINQLNKTVIIVSHDRYFLDKTVSKVWELSREGLVQYQGNYSSYKHQKEIKIKNINKKFEKQQREIKHLNEVINERKDWFDKAHKAAGQNDFLRSKSKKHISVLRSKERQLERIEENKIEKPKKDMSPCYDIINKSVSNIKLPRYLIQIKELYKSFGSKSIFSRADMSLLRGEKAAVLGKNGSGKTTLLNIINGFDKDFDGIVTINPSLKLGYFHQELSNLDYDKSILDNVKSEEFTEDRVRLLLASLLFKGDDVFKKVHNLSMGEKCRAAFAKLILSGANLLILDEPTNYMDIVSKEKIEEVLNDYQGSILFVSHDRYFINKIADKIFEIEDLKINAYYGNYDDYVSKKEKINLTNNGDTEFKNAMDMVSKLECELAYLGGKFNDKLIEEEKINLNKLFLEKSKELRFYKDKINNGKQ